VIDNTTAPATVLATSQRLSLWRSVDQGKSFVPYQASGLPSTEARAFIAPLVAGTGNPLPIYAGLTHIYRSTDHGASFAGVGSTLLAPSTGETVSAIAQAPNNRNVLYAATSLGRIWVTTNAWAASPTWTSINNSDDPVPYRFITDLAVDPGAPGTVYVALSGFGTSHVYRSVNYGQDWTNISSNLPNTPTNAIAVYPRSSGRRVLVGTDVGVFVSDDLGASWARYQAGLPNVVVSDLLVDTAANRIVAATYGRGMFSSCAGSAPAYDAFGSPSTMTGASGTTTLSSRCAGKQSGEPSHSPDANPGGASIWTSWTAPATGTVTFSTAGSGFDTELAAYTGTSVGALTAVAKNDDASSTVRTSSITFNATAGTTYRIAVDGYLYNGYALARNGGVKLTWSP
jgi:hypothetical protein